MIPYEYVSPQARRERVISDWVDQARQRRSLKARLVMLLQVDRNQAVGSLLFKTNESGIYYAKIRGNVALRPRLCLGPREPDAEVTFLYRAVEVNFRINPPDANERARERMREVEADESRRERIDVASLFC